MPTRVVVLGAGFGGLELTTRLADEFGDEVHVTLIDTSEAFEMIETSADGEEARCRRINKRLGWLLDALRA